MTLRFQQGGTLPLAEYLPFTGLLTASNTSIPAAGGTSSLVSDGQKDLLKLVSQMKGLPSDASKLIEDLQDVYTETNLFNNGELDSQDLTTTYLSTLQKIKFAEFNEDLFKLAEKTVRDNGGLHEYAIDSYGRLIVLNGKNGKIKHMSLLDFYALGDNPEYIPLTNSNLLYYRAQSPEFAFKNDFIEVASNGIGQEKVNKILLESLSKIGSSSIVDEGYTARQNGEITRGISILLDLARQGKSTEEIWGNNGLLSLDGIYKTSSLNKDLKNLIKLAAEYLWATMPKNVRTWLAMKSGNSSDPNLGAQDLMMTMLLSGHTTESKFNVTLLKDLNPDGTKRSDSDGSGGKEKLRIGWLQHVQAGDGGRVATMHVNLGGDNYAAGMSITGSGYGMAVTPDGKAIGQTSMYNMVENSRLKGIALGFYFGEQKMSLNDLNYIAYTGEELLRVNLPVKSDGSPDFNLLREYNQAYQEFLMTNLSKEDEKRIFGSNPNLASLTNADGTLNMNRFAPFVLVNGITTDKLAKLDTTNNNYIAEQKADPRLYLLIKQSLATGTESKPVYPDIDEYGWSEAPFLSWGEWLNSYDHIYEGVLYIPISMNRNASAMYENQKLPQNEQDNLEIEYQLNPAFLNFNAEGNSVDFLRN